MIDIDGLDASDLDTDLTLAIAGIDGEMQAAVDWMDDAFGEIKASELAPVQYLKNLIAKLFTQG